MLALLKIGSFFKDVWAFFTVHWKIALAVLVAIALLASFTFGVYSFAKSMAKDQLKAIQETSEAVGRAEANTDTLKKQAELMQAELVATNKRLDALNDSLGDIRLENQKVQKSINNYDAKTVAKTQGPQAVEDWANKTNNELFQDISKESKK